jgi:2,3-bisphosphoglycerate-independent phosphoglycerate mutase
MLRKVVFVVFDGLGDRPIEALGGLTPLEAARTPNLDLIASAGICGMVYTIGRGVMPGSDTSHLNLLGYPPSEFYTGRGPIEAVGVGLRGAAGDVALRGNFGTVDSDWVVRDRRAGRIANATRFAQVIDGITVEDVRFTVRAGTAHRAAVVMQGQGLSSQITAMDPKEEGVQVRCCNPLYDTREASHTAKAVNAFAKEAYGRLRDLQENREREAQGLLPANFLLLRGAGAFAQVPSFRDRFGFRACCIAGGGLYKGVATLVGMDLVEVEGATAQPDTNVRGKFRKAVEVTADYDFVFVHVKPTDSLAEDGNFLGKKDFIEKIDAAAEELRKLADDVLLVLTADHSTPCELKKHSADPVPIVIHGRGVRTDAVKSFGERSCAQGGLGIFDGDGVMKEVLNLTARTSIFGS